MDDATYVITACRPRLYCNCNEPIISLAFYKGKRQLPSSPIPNPEPARLERTLEAFSMAVLRADCSAA